MVRSNWSGSEKRSTSSTWVEACGEEYRWVMQVKGLGAIILRADSDPDTGRLIFSGVSTLTNAEIGLWE